MNIKVNSLVVTRHQATFDALPKPHWLWTGRLSDNKWYIKSNKYACGYYLIDFDQPILPWPNPSSLLDEQHEADLITIKMVLYLSLEPKPVGWNKAPGSVKQTFASHVTFVRWRNGNRVRTNASLTSAWFNKFDSSMKNSSREGLLKLSSRVRRVLSAVDSGELVLQKTRRNEVSSNSLARLLGVSAGSALTTSSRRAIETYFRLKKQRLSRIADGRTEPLEVGTTTILENATRYYRVWYDLWKLRDYLNHDRIGFQAFLRPSDIADWLKNWASKAERTDDAPAYQTSFLINAALKLLLDPVSVEMINVIKAGVDKQGNAKNYEKLTQCNQNLARIGFGPVSVHYQKGRWKTKGTSLYRFVFTILPAAARIVIAAFSARRDDEILSAQIDCVEEDSLSNNWLNCLIVKNLNRVDRIPVPKSVALAVSLLQKIRGLGNKSGTKLFDFRCPVSGNSVKVKINSQFDMVSSYLGVPLLDDGTAWHFTPHQFRKFFGVTYFYRWAFPNLTALTFQYRHFNSTTTLGYIELKAAEALRSQDEKLAAWRLREIERKTDLEGGRRGFVAWIVDLVVKGGELGGAAGRRITAEINRLKELFLPELTITDGIAAGDNNFNAALANITTQINFEAHPEGHSLCNCGSSVDDTCQSKCLALKQRLTGTAPTAATGPDFDYADDTECLVCPHRGSLPLMAPRWELQISSLEKALPAASSGMAAAMHQRIDIIREHAFERS